MGYTLLSSEEVHPESTLDLSAVSSRPNQLTDYWFQAQLGDLG